MFGQRPTIEFFSIYKEDFGAIAPPVPAGKIIPEWYKQLLAVDPAVMSADSPGMTVKACPAFLDAMTEGWIICMPADLRVELSGGNKKMTLGTSYVRPVASYHYNYQIKGSPDDDKVIIKFHTMWGVRTAPGYSCLFVPPLNRHSDFTVLSGIIDTDRFQQQISPPAIFTRDDGMFTIEKGTPIIQVIPFRRERFTSKVQAGDASDNVQLRQVFSESGWYRKYLRAKR